jgi:hypothetical protein
MRGACAKMCAGKRIASGAAPGPACWHGPRGRHDMKNIPVLHVCEPRPLDRIPRSPLADRTVAFSDPDIQEMYADAESTVRAKIVDCNRLH